MGLHYSCDDERGNKFIPRSYNEAGEKVERGVGKMKSNGPGR